MNCAAKKSDERNKPRRYAYVNALTVRLDMSSVFELHLYLQLKFQFQQVKKIIVHTDHQLSNVC